jgi:hypothetical protein
MQGFPRGSPSFSRANKPRAELARDRPPRHLVSTREVDPGLSTPFPGKSVHWSRRRERNPRLALVLATEKATCRGATPPTSGPCSTGDRSGALPSASSPRSSPLPCFPSPAAVLSRSAPPQIPVPSGDDDARRSRFSFSSFDDG